MAASRCVAATLWAMGPLLAAGLLVAPSPSTNKGGAECAMLLRAPGCVTRRGFDFECTWDLLRPDLVTTTFTYHFAGERHNHCPVTVQRRRDNVSASYACAIPVRQVSMYRDLIIEMKAWHHPASPPCQTKNIVRVEEAVHTEPPRALWARDTERPGELLAGWAAPEADMIVTATLTYQLSYSRTRNRTDPTVQTGSTEYALRGLLPGAPYWLRVRTEPDGETLRGSWSAWSTPVMATPRALPGVLCLQCTIMRDLRTLLCHYTSVSPGKNYSIFCRNEELGSEWECGTGSGQPGSPCFLALPSPLTRVRLFVRDRDPPRRRVLSTEPFCLADVDPNGSLSDVAKPHGLPVGVPTEMGKRELRLTWSETGSGKPDCEGEPASPCTDVGQNEGEVQGGKSRPLQAPEPSEEGGRGGDSAGRWENSEKTEAVITSNSERPRWTLAYVIPFALLMSAVFVIIKGRMRSIKQKVWPAVPNLESSFDELFTVFKGNFQEWARPERGGRVRPACEVEERLICLVEVVSEGDRKEERGEQEEADKREEAEGQTEHLPRYAWSHRKAQNAYVLRGGDVAGGHGEGEVELRSLDLHGDGDEEDADNDDNEVDAAAVDNKEFAAEHDDEDDPHGNYIATVSVEDDNYEDATADEHNVAVAEDCNATVDNEDAASTAVHDIDDTDVHSGEHDDNADENNDASAGNEDPASTYGHFSAAAADGGADDDPDALTVNEAATYTHDYSAADIVDDTAVGSVEDVGAAAGTFTSDESNGDDYNHHRRPMQLRSNLNGEVSENPGILLAPGKHSQDPYPGIKLFALRYERVWWGIGVGPPGLGCQPSAANILVEGGGDEEHAGRATTVEVAGSQDITNMAYVMRKEAREAASGSYVNAT